MTATPASHGSRVLLADPLASEGLEILRQAGLELVELADDDRARLTEVLEDFDAVVVRSRTKLAREHLEGNERLKVIARAGVGIDNIDLAAATDRGILVVNAPTANLLSATEHTFALMLALARNVAAADASIKRGEWDRKRYVGVELKGKTLGVVGFGRIGQGVAARAQAFGMEVVAHDPYLDATVAERLGVKMAELDDLLAGADVVTLHVPLTDATRRLIGAAELERMQSGAMLVNCARGGIVDEAALVEALDAGHLAGAALDVFEVEPPEQGELTQHPKVVATPHIGAQTAEAQERIAQQTAEMLIAALDGSLAVTAVNLPFRPAGPQGAPYLHLAERLGHLASTLLNRPVARVQVDLWGVDEALEVPAAVAALKGVLTSILGGAVNFVNAERIAAGRGIEVVRATHAEGIEYPRLVGVSLAGEDRAVELRGTVLPDGSSRVVAVDGFRLEFQPEGKLLMLANRDVPGVVGKLGALLGKAGVNIADIHLARDSNERARAVIRVDQTPGGEVLTELAALPEVMAVQLVEVESE